MKGRIDISRSGKKPIFITLEDDLSGVPVIEIEMTPEDFALFLTGLSGRECKFKLYNSPFVGKRREYKEAQVTFPGEGWGITDEQKAKGLEPFLVDGWRVFYQDQVGKDRYRVKDTPRTFTVTFIRFVEVEEDSGDPSA
jgi:hypothetical protein